MSKDPIELWPLIWIAAAIGFFVCVYQMKYNEHELQLKQLEYQRIQYEESN